MRNLKSNSVNKTRIINNQFGEFEVDLTKELLFPTGLIGIAKASRFALLPCPIERFKDFMILQSLERDDLAFMVLPIGDIKQSEYHEAGELESSAKLLGIDPEDVAVVLIVSMKQNEDGKKLVTNTRAPIFIDSKYMAGAQYVLSNPNYEIQKEL